MQQRSLWLQRSLWIPGLLLLLTGCGSGHARVDVGPIEIAITAFVPGATKAAGAEVDFAVFVDNALQAGDAVGDVARVTFTAFDGTPFLEAESATLLTTATIVGPHQLVGLCPPAGLVGTDTIFATVTLTFPSGASARSSTAIARFGPPPLEVLGFGPTPTVVGAVAQAFEVTGTGFGPIGASVEVEFLLAGGAQLCDGRSAFSVAASIASPSRIAGMRPPTPVRTPISVRLRVTQASGQATSDAPVLTLEPHPGGGVFVDWGHVPNTAETASMAVGDLNSDGVPDLVTANASAPDLHVFLGDGTGRWVTGPVLGASANSSGASVAVGDLDRDGDLDLVRVLDDAEGTAVFRNNGRSGWIDTGITLPARPYTHITLGDLDRNGTLDAVVSVRGSGARILLNNGAGLFTDTGQSLGSGGHVAGLGDFDRDGDLDLAVGSSTRMSLYTNDGSGSFQFTGQSLGSGTLQDVGFGDLNGDGQLDVVGAFRTRGARAYLGNGSGSFAYTGQELLSLRGSDGKSTWAVALADVDGDCDVDVVLGHAPGAGPVSNDGDEVWLNDGAAVFADSGQRLGSSEHSLALALVDLDQDGAPDLISAQAGGPAVRLFRNQGER